MPKIKSCFVQGDRKTNNVFITSGFQPPTNADLLDRVEIGAYMQGYASGGSIEHVFLGGEVDISVKKQLINTMFDTPMNYMTLSPIVSVCDTCKHKSVGEHFVCPNCGDAEHMLVYARIIGYVRPIVSGKITINEDGIINGDENYWQDSRRRDWVERDKLMP